MIVLCFLQIRISYPLLCILVKSVSQSVMHSAAQSVRADESGC